MTLTAKGEATRQRIVEGAAKQLRSAGSGEFTLDDVLATTHTSKGQLFHYFPGGKEELLLAVTRLEADRVLDEQQPHLSQLDSWESWALWRDAIVARYRAQGTNCPLSSLMQQATMTPGAAEVAEVLLGNWQAELRRGILTMQGSGLIAAEVDADAASASLLAGIQGGVAILRTTGSTHHLEAVLDALIDRLRPAPRMPRVPSDDGDSVSSGRARAVDMAESNSAR